MPINENTNFMDTNDFFELLNSKSNSILMENEIIRDKIFPLFLNYVPKHAKIVYFDFDAWLRTYSTFHNLDQKIILINPDSLNFEQSLLSFLSWTVPSFDLLILDSLTTLYQMLDKSSNHTLANQKFGYYFSNIINLVHRIDSKILISNFPIKKSNDPWYKNYLGSKLMKHMTDNIVIMDYKNTTIHCDVIQTIKPISRMDFCLSIKRP
jgi:hypothetical protein